MVDFLLAASPSSSYPPPRLVPWGFLVQSVFCWSLPPGIWLYLATARLSCLVVWSVVTARLLSLLFLKGFDPVWSSALYTMLRVLFRASFRGTSGRAGQTHLGNYGDT